MNNSDLPSHSAWLQDTTLRFSIRGPKLKAIDAAIQAHEQLIKRYEIGQLSFENLDKQQPKAIENLGRALAVWKSSQGSGQEWRANPRNKNGAFTKLSVAFTNYNIAMDREKFTPSASHDAELTRARLGVIYLFSRLSVHASVARMLILPAVSIAGFLDGQVSDNPYDLFGHAGDSTAANIGNNVMHGIRFIGEPLISTGEIIESGIKNTPNVKSASLFMDMVDWLTDFASKLGHNFIELFYRQEMKDGPHVVQISMILSVVKSAITMGAIVLCDSLTNFASDGLRLIRHLTRIADAAVDGIRSWWRSKNVSILEGHPSIICDTLKAKMSGQVSKGVYNTIKASAGIAIQLILPGIGSVIRAVSNIILSVFETIYNIIEHYVTVTTIRGIIYQCQYLWKQYKKNQNQQQNMAARKPLFHEDSKRFATWYREIAKSVPSLIALTLNSGICGDKMNFINMFDSYTEGPIKQDKFDKGVEYVDSLKDYSANFLRTSDYRFTSDYPDVAGYINIAKKFDTNTQSKAWKFLKTAADI